MGDRAMKRIDPVIMEVVRHGFIALADEMRINLMRSSYNPIIYEVLDFSVGVFDAKGDMIAQSAGLPIFLGDLGAAVKTVIQDVGTRDIQPGDIYLINDTYTTGVHLNDMTAIAPVFHDGRLVGFAVSRAHWLDVGGKSPGGAADTTDIFQEGLRLRSVRLVEAGEMNRSVLQIIRDNVRWPEAQIGDLRAQIAACRTGETRFLELVERFGEEALLDVVAAIFRQGEEAGRRAIRAMPDGTWCAEARLDGDGVGSGPLVVKAAVTISGDEMTVDLTGSAGQTLGPVNCGLSATVAACRTALKCLTNPMSPVNEGDFVPLKVVVPRDSIFNVRPPGAAFLDGPTVILLIDVVLKALASDLADAVPAAHYGDMAGFMIYGTDGASGRQFIHQEPEGGGWGAWAGHDGENVLIFIADGDTRNVPVEVIESKYPLRVERYQLREDSGGPGKWRGGLGHYRDYRVLSDEAFMTAIMERSVCPPWGLAGGSAAAHDLVVVNPGRPDETIVMKATAYRLRHGDVCSVRTGGGGGYGNPFERDPAAVRDDVVRGLVTLEAARLDYGVVIDPATFLVDEAATRFSRNQGRGKDGSVAGEPPAIVPGV
ncbi:MAG: hydantoinase B/oxoprolinase family protein [Bacillota bacterium]|nr:MAG: hydantoinase B/oxoprolinase family protein [Bacillota bacterium]